MKTETSMIFNVLVKKEKGLYVAHCLELDIVATAKDLDQVRNDVLDLIKAQVDYAFSNENLDHLYHPAPQAVWQEFYACKNQTEKKIDIESIYKTKGVKGFIPPWIIARTCEALTSCHA